MIARQLRWEAGRWLDVAQTPVHSARHAPRGRPTQPVGSGVESEKKCAEGKGAMQFRDIVAVVDDDEINREIVRRMLESVYIEVRGYVCASAFLQDPEHGRVGCMVLDVRMPGMSGMELQRILIDQGSQVPVVFLTAHGDVPMAVEAMRRGAAGF